MTKPRHFLSISDFDAEGLVGLIRSSAAHKEKRRNPAARFLADQAVALVFEKPSTRTRVSFEAAAAELGGVGVYLDARGSQLGRGEPLGDTANVLSSYCSAIVYRTFGHSRVEELAAGASVPVINGLTDWNHPCQLIADLHTVFEEVGGDMAALRARRYAWIGDGNNMTHSWLHCAGLLGLDLAIACPEGYDPDPSVVGWARDKMSSLGAGSVTLVRKPEEAIAGADVVSTDVWASMGQEEEAAARREAFAGYCIDEAMWKATGEGAIFLHCLPAHRGEEVSAGVLEGSASRVWRQAENRLHAHKAILEWSLT